MSCQSLKHNQTQLHLTESLWGYLRFFITRGHITTLSPLKLWLHLIFLVSTKNMRLDVLSNPFCARGNSHPCVTHESIRPLHPRSQDKLSEYNPWKIMVGIVTFFCVQSPRTQKQHTLWNTVCKNTFTLYVLYKDKEKKIKSLSWLYVVPPEDVLK